jgi:uncharacterized protein YcgL (UPF0745 family)
VVRVTGLIRDLQLRARMKIERMEDENVKQALSERGVVLREGMASLAASSVERRPPFDKVALPSGLEPYKAYLLSHPDEIGWVTTAFIKLMELKIAGDLVRDQSWINRWLEFKKAYEAEYGAPTYIPRKFKASVLKKKDVTRVVREMMKRFGYDADKSPSSTVIRVSKNTSCAEKFVVDFELGTYGNTRFSVFIGTTDPEFSVQLEDFLCTDKRSLFFSTIDECQSAAQDVSELLNYSLPIFEEAVCGILQK